MAIENHPRLDDGSPFPTLFWLTCPILVKRASRLESEGRMTDVNHDLAQDGAFRDRLRDAMARLRARRDEHEPLEDASPPGGGPERVKCLHAHLAHQLAAPPNPVGSAALSGTGWPDCVVPCVPPRQAEVSEAPSW